MNLIKTTLTGAVLLSLSTPMAFAQGTLADQVFSEVEKRIIREHYGVPATQQQSDSSAPKWAVKDGEAEDDQNSDSDDDQDEEDGQRGDKGKGKDKGKDKGKGKGKDKGNGKDKAKGKDKDKSKGLPPGLAKRDQLPPGLAKQLRDKGRLPPGLAKRDLPTDLAAQLPARPDDQEVTIVEGDVVLADKATGIILDVLKDVVTNGGGTTTPNADGTLAPPTPQNGADQGTEDNMLDHLLRGIFGGRS